MPVTSFAVQSARSRMMGGFMKGFQRSTLIAGLGLYSLSGASATNREDVLLRTTLEQLSVADLLCMASTLSKDETVKLGGVVEPFHHMPSESLKHSKDSGASSDRPKIVSCRSCPSFLKWLKPDLAYARVSCMCVNHREQVDNYIRALEREVEKLKSKLKRTERTNYLLTDYYDKHEVPNVLNVVRSLVPPMLDPCFKHEIDTIRKDNFNRQMTEIVQCFFLEYFSFCLAKPHDKQLCEMYISNNKERLAAEISELLKNDSDSLREDVDIKQVINSLISKICNCGNNKLGDSVEVEFLNEQTDFEIQIENISRGRTTFRGWNQDPLIELREDKKILQEQLFLAKKLLCRMSDKLKEQKKQYDAVVRSNKDLYSSWKESDIRAAWIYQQVVRTGGVPTVQNPVSSVINENADLRIAVMQIRENNVILRGKIAKLEEELKNNQKEKEKVTEEKKTMNQKLETLNSLNDQLQKDSDTLKEDNERLKDEVKRSNSMVDELKNKIKDLQQSSEQETKRVNWLESRLSDEEEHRKDAQKRLAELRRTTSKPI